MSKNKVLKKIAEDARIEKTAQTVIDSVNQGQITDSKEFADKIFEELLKNLHINGLDD